MKFRVLSLLLLTTWGVVSQNFINVDNLWSSSSVFQTYKDHALVGHVIKTLHVLFVGECVEKCQNTLECFSYNYFHNVSTGGICELNRSNKNQSETLYIRLHGYQYGEPEDFQYCEGDICVQKNALPDSWYRINDSLVKAYFLPKTWQDAKSFCVSLGGNLMSVHSEIENTFLKKVLLYPTFWKRYSLDGNDVAGEVTLQNGAKFVTKEGRKAVIFDGDNDYAQIKSFDARTSDLTIAFWFRVKSLPTAMNLFNDVKDSKRQFNFRSSNDRSLTIEMKTKGKMIIATTAKSSYPIDKWAHFAVTWNRTSKEMKVYINQKVKTSKIATHVNIDLIDTGNTKYILGNNGEFHLNGWMSDFYVFKNALTKTQISKVADGLALDAWLGMNDIDTEGSLKWSNNQTVSFMGYISNQELKDCVAMRRKNFYTMHWSIQSCNNLNAFICEKPVV